MHISRPASLVVVSVLSLGLLAGCGGDDESSEKDAEQINKLVSALEEHDDVMNVYTNHEEAASAG